MSRLHARAPGARRLADSRALLALALALVSWSSAAPAIERPLWELGLGAAGLRLPHYRGSDQYHDWLLPAPYLVYRGKIFKADREGARAVLFESDRLDFDLSAAATAPTRSDDNDAREGMDDLDATLELGPNLNWTAARGPGWKVDLRLPVRAAFTVESSPRFVGWTATPKINLDLANLAGSGFNLGVQGGPVFGSRRFHGYFYDVAGADVAPDRPAYRAAGGYSGTQITAALSRRYPRVWAGAFVRFDLLNGARFEDSPLVQRRNNLSFGIALSWVFATSSRSVSSAE